MFNLVNKKHSFSTTIFKYKIFWTILTKVTKNKNSRIKNPSNKMFIYSNKKDLERVCWHKHNLLMFSKNFEFLPNFTKLFKLCQTFIITPTFT